MKSICLILVLYFISISNFQAQNVYSDSWDGIAYIMFKEQVPVIKTNGKIVEIEKIKLLNDLSEEYGIVQVEKINYFSPDENMQRIFRIYFNQFHKIDYLIKELLNNHDVKYAERAPIFETFAIINDANYLASANNRWHLDKINAQNAWDTPRQTNNIKIAVIDKAMDTDHPDLVAQWDTLYDIFDNDNNTNPPYGVSDNDPSWSHGTHTSGLAGATTNNNIGIASVAYDVKLMGIKISNNLEMNINGVNAPPGSMIAAYEAVTWAADNGADIISMSWGGRYYSLIKQEIVNYAAITKKCLLLAGAGNYGTSDKYYPAALENVIAVAGTNGDDKLNTVGMPPLYVSSGSNYGPWVDVCAPGFGMTNSNDNNKIYSTSYDNSYMTIGGTSMATPIVASLAALIKSINPALSSNSIENIIKSTCVNISSLQIDTDRRNGVGAGRINAEAAAILAYSTINQIVPDFTSDYKTIYEGESINFTDLSAGIGINSWNWTFTGSTTNNSSVQNPTNIIFNNAGTYNISLTISNNDTTASITKNSYITVRPISTNWIEQSSSFPNPNRCIKNISIVDDNIAWATAYDGVNEFILNEFTRTNNGGITWESGKISDNNIPLGYRISNIKPINYNIAYMCMHNAFSDSPNNERGGIFITTDGGNSWIKQTTALFNSTTSFPIAVHFFNENDGWCVGNPVSNNFEMYTTEDGGNTWTKVISSNIPVAQAAELMTIGQYESYNEILWFATSKGRVYKSVNKGKNWTVYSTGLSKINKITFANENIGIVQNISKNILNTHIVTFENKRTTNGGANWSSFTPGNGIRKTSIDFAKGNPSLLVSVGTDGTENETQGSSYSIDMGSTWIPIDEGCHYNEVKMYNSYIGYAGGNNRSATRGGIYKWKSIVSNIENDVNSKNNNFSIYPNPAKDFINIKLSQHNKPINISITNLMGQTVKYEKYKSSENNIRLNISSIKAGTYLLKIDNGDEIEYQKIVIH